MSAERRQFSRLPGPYDGSWNGASGNRDCRITDLSPGGCFIDSFATPEIGASIMVTLTFGASLFTVPARVVYLDRIQGFGVRFEESDHARALAYAMSPPQR
jgi:hypothetical protein